MAMDAAYPDAAPGPTRAGVDRIAIIGSMGSGKSTVARLVGDRLSLPVIDSDSWIESRIGTSGAIIAAEMGVVELHRLEVDMLRHTIESPASFVVTPAASVVDDSVSRQLLAALPLVAWLDLDAEIGYERAVRGSHRRSLTSAEYRSLHAQRRPHFAAVAHVRLSAERSPFVLADEVVQAADRSAR